MLLYSRLIIYDDYFKGEKMKNKGIYQTEAHTLLQELKAKPYDLTADNALNKERIKKMRCDVADVGRVDDTCVTARCAETADTHTEYPCKFDTNVLPWWCYLTFSSQLLHAPRNPRGNLTTSCFLSQLSNLTKSSRKPHAGGDGALNPEPK